MTTPPDPHQPDPLTMTQVATTPRVDTGDDRPIVVTGVAGFIGHRTARLLLEAGRQVIGIDGFTPYYDRAIKQRRADDLAAHPTFTLHEALLTPETCLLFEGSAAVIHEAAQPGVRDSWRHFDDYVDLNVRATKHVLDAAVELEIPRVVVASSSSVYGDAPTYPTAETDQVNPRSPYGITKLAAERLAVAYSLERGLSTVCLRYFTVYGPGQRPDMAIQRLLHAAHAETPFPLFGDGTQIRDFTFVDDVARANVLAATRPAEPGSVYNVCSEEPVTLADVIAEVERVTERTVLLDHKPVAMGDVKRTGGTAERLRTDFGWAATTSIASGIEQQDADVRDTLGIEPVS